MKKLEKMAWQIAAANDNEPATFWGELSTESQEHYLTKAATAIGSVEHRMLNGNWTDAIELFVVTPGMKLEYLDHKYFGHDVIILGDYVMDELRKNG